MRPVKEANETIFDTKDYSMLKFLEYKLVIEIVLM